MNNVNRFNTPQRFGLGLSLLLAMILVVGPGCSTVDANEPPPMVEPGPPPVPDPTPNPDPPPASKVAVGAAYQNASDSRVLLINEEGTRFVYWNPANGTFSGGDDIDDLENGQLPLGSVGASASRYDNTETYFFDEEGKQYTIYERATSEFDEVSVFGDDDGEFGDPELEDVGTALVVSPVGSSSNPNRIFFFNKLGTHYQVWDYENETWSRVFTFVTEFGGGGAPIASVGAAVYVEAENVFYMFNREGTKYTIYNGTFSAAFEVTQLGNGSLSFD